MANWLEPFIKNSPIASQEALADLIGVSRATVNRLANDHSKLKRDRAALMAEHLGVSTEDLMLNRLPWEAKTSATPEPDGVQRGRSLGSAIVVATVEAGAWREVDEFDQSSPEWVAVPPDDKYPDATQDVYNVAGDSMNALQPHPITPGSRVVAVRYDEIASRSPLRDGLVVVVQRSRNGGQERELTVKQVAWFDDRIEFQPRSTNPKHKPIVVEHDTWEDNGVEVAIVGLVRDIIHRLPG
ncbi:Helix-turn-helix protein [Devosia sp. LC5]|uniref:LexA family protein n=1 Tax=Devosia sp. LC5 TaxID=1502724 RepID=UPI0004E4098D|nr:LexA family transcriptional regulator [Devosia sp. LC5]KFC62748.1 Helix-turn-helix protein [Devosia sp. LC5]